MQGVAKGFLASLPDNEWTRLKLWAATHPDDPLAADIQGYMEYTGNQIKGFLDMLESEQSALIEYKKSVSEMLKVVEADGRLIRLCKAFIFKPDNGGWTIGTPGKKPVFLYGTKGLQYIHKLLSRPGEPIDCTELVCDGLPHPDMISLPEDKDRYDHSDFSEDEWKKGPMEAEEDQPMIDTGAALQTKAQHRQLEEQKRSALARGNEDLAAKLDAEMEKIEAYLKKTIGKGGRIRKHGPGEKARQNVKKAIDAALDKIRLECPAAHAALTINTGYSCAYMGTEEWDT